MSGFPLPRHLSRTCLLITVILLCGVPGGLARVRLDNGIERWVAGDAARDHYADFQRDFGGDDFLLLAYAGDDLFEEDALDVQGAVLDAIERLPEVDTVQSLPTLFREHFGAEDGAELAEEIAASPFYEGAIISRDRTMAGMIIGSREDFSPAARRAYVAAIRRAAEPLRAAGMGVYLVGPGVLNATLDTASEAESRRLLPAAVVASLAVLLLLLRSVKRVLIVAVVASLSLAITAGLMGWLGLTFNMVTVALPPVLWVLSAAYAVHLLRYYDEARTEGHASEAAIARALAWGVRPCLLAALTTALGFLALRTADMTPVRELGLAAALGIPVAFAVTFGMGPILLRLLRLAPVAPSRWHSRIATWVTRMVLAATGPRPAGPILFVSAVILVGSGLLATRVAIESNPLRFLDPATDVVRDSAVVSARFTGLYTLETVLELPGSWLEPAAWPGIEAQMAALASAPGVARVLSPLDYLKQLNRWQQGGGPDSYRLPDDGAAASALIAALSEADRAPLDALVSPDGTRVRLSALIRVMDGHELLAIVRASERALADGGIPGYHTGVVLRLVRAQFALIETQLKSLGLAVAIIFGCIALGLRPVRVVLLSILPNLAPVLVLFGLMGLASIPLDPATVMVAAMALGIAVDDTLHLLVTRAERLRAGEASATALASALRINGPAMIATSLTACAGFLALGFSNFAPIRYFGLLSAAAMAVALAADLWLLPALIQATTPTKETRP